jgi:hypothetical protein
MKSDKIGAVEDRLAELYGTVIARFPLSGKITQVTAPLHSSLSAENTGI